MSKVVLDASAVLAVLNREKGSEAIAQLMDDAIIAVFVSFEVHKSCGFPPARE